MYGRLLSIGLLINLLAGCITLPSASHGGVIHSTSRLTAFPHDNKLLASTGLISRVAHRSSSAPKVLPTADFDGSIAMPSKTLNEANENADPILEPLTEWQSLNFNPVDVDLLPDRTKSSSVWRRIGEDQLNFYSGESLIEMGVLFSAGAAMANTSADAQIQKHFQASVRGATSDDWFEFLRANKELGNGVYTLPIMGAAWVANEYFDGPPVVEELGTWGERSFRGFLVGAPPLVIMQRVTGGSRPYETLEDSEWHPFRDNNGVSGHAFMSSLPFITAAKMTDDPWKKTLWYAASTVGPLSRVNDNAHYPSQIGLGWGLAFFAATAVQQTDTDSRGWSLLSHAPSGGSGFALQYRW